jgi:hypothetical protein
VSCFYFYSGFLLRSRFIFLWTKDTPWKTDELLCADLTCPCSERSRAIERYIWLYQPHISFTINRTSQPLCFLLQLKIHPHVSRTLGDWPIKAIEKGPRCQLRSEEKLQGEARTWISFTELNRIPAKCAVACGCCWRWGHFVKTLSWSSRCENDACLTNRSNTCLSCFAMKNFCRFLLPIELLTPHT